MNRNLKLAAFALGLLAVVWVAFGYISGHLLAFSVSCIIAIVYIAGAAEMRRFDTNTTALAQALQTIPDDLGHLGEWLQQVPATLQNTVRLRIEGERVALPGPSITPYLVGLLVLLGMLGTFLGMVVTLNGAVLALESTTDLHTIRAALAAPVKGLGVAFGTSVAGVATSAMLGLISTLCRRDRLRIGQLLDSKIASVLRDFSLAHQRQETFKAIQAQSQMLPELVGKLDAMMTQMAEQNRLLGEQLLSGQQRFHEEAKEQYTELAQSVDQSLKASLKDSATVAAETIQPVVTATMAGIAGETRSLHDKLFGTVATQMAGITDRFTETVSTVSDTWAQAISQHEQLTDTQHQHLQSAFAAYADTFEQRSAALIASVDDTQTRLQATAAQQHAALAETTAANQQQLATTLIGQFDGVTTRLDQAVSTVAATFNERTQALLATIDASHTAFTQATQAQQATVTEHVANQFDGVATRLDQVVSTVAATFDERTRALLASIDASHGAFAQTTQAQQATVTAQVANQFEDVTTRLDQAVSTVASTFNERTQALLASIDASHTAFTQATQAQQTAITEQVANQFGGVTARLDQAVGTVAATFDERTQSLLTAIDTSHRDFAQTTHAQQTAIAGQVASQLDGIAQRFDGAVQTVSTTWTNALAKHEQASDSLTQALEQTQTQLANTFAQRSAALLTDMHTRQSAWQSEWVAGEQTRQARFTDALTDLASKLETQWQQHGSTTLAQQETITQTLGDTARELVSAHQRQAETTIAEVTRLMQIAAEAPKAAADVIGQLRKELSASVVRDNTLLEERGRIMETLSALLDAINHASTEQRSAIDALVSSSTDLLERTGSQFAAKVDSEAGRLVEIGASITGGALEVASLGDAFGIAVKLFAESNDKMMATLQRIEAGLTKSLTRSDEQLAYYVAQAREIIDLSILSQKKMVDDLQRTAQLSDNEA